MEGQVQMVQPGAPGSQGRQIMVAPPPPVGCPPGLEYLTQIDQLLVQQQIELLEVLTGFETNNKYLITNSLGQQVYFAAEQTDCLMRMCCGGGRSFEISILDNMGREVMHLSRPLRCGLCWCPQSCTHEVEVCAPPGVPIGYIIQKTSCWLPEFDVCNVRREKVLHVSGPCCPCGCVDIPFHVLANDGSEIGAITKQFRGFLAEAFTDADRFGITFPMNLDVNVKATLMGALFLIDFMFFEQNNN